MKAGRQRFLVGRRGIVAVIVLGMAACSGGGSASPPSSATKPAATGAPTSSDPTTTTGTTTTGTTTTIATPTDPPQTLFGDALAKRLGPNGEVDAKLALDLFASAYGNAAALGATVLPAGSFGASMALRAIARHWDELTDAQRSIIQAQLDVKPESVDVLTEGQPSSRRGSARHPSRPRTSLATIAGDALVAIESHWGARATFHLDLETMPTDLPPSSTGDSVLADSIAVRADGTPTSGVADYGTCRVRVFPALAALASPQDTVETLAHELFHCFQFTVANPTGEFGGPDWVIEGQAEWVGASISGGARTVADWYRDWVRIDRALWLRTYDAVGFYDSLDRRGIDPWSVFRAMLGAPLAPVTAAFDAAVGSHGVHFLGEVIANRAAESSVGAPWIPVGPGAPISLNRQSPVEIATGETRASGSDVKPYDSAFFTVHFADPVAVVQSDAAPWSVGTAGHETILDAPGAQPMCLLDACVCADGSSLDIPSFGANAVVVGGIANPTLATITANASVRGVPIEQACAELPHRPNLACMVGSWHQASVEFAPEYQAGIDTVGFNGVVAGNSLDIAPNFAFILSDDGTHPTTFNQTLNDGTTVSGTFSAVGRIDGTVSGTLGSAVFATGSVDGTIHISVNVAGVPVNSDQPWPNLFNGTATVTCAAGTLTVGFPGVTVHFASG